jgi:hypothetical protein
VRYHRIRSGFVIVLFRDELYPIRTRDDARADVFDYVERFYNRPQTFDNRLRQAG